MDALAEAVNKERNSIGTRDMSYILWGFAKAKHVLKRSFFSTLASEITNNLQVNRLSACDR